MQRDPELCDIKNERRRNSASTREQVVVWEGRMWQRHRSQGQFACHLVSKYYQFIIHPLVNLFRCVGKVDTNTLKINYEYNKANLTPTVRAVTVLLQMLLQCCYSPITVLLQCYHTQSSAPEGERQMCCSLLKMFVQGDAAATKTDFSDSCLSCPEIK